MKTSGVLLCVCLAILSSNALAQSVVYPLDVGTAWNWSLYWNPGAYRVEIKRDTLVPNGHLYAIIPAYWSIPERWERQEGTRVYRYGPGAAQEWLLFDFAKSPGDTISPFVVMQSAHMDTLFGRSRRTWEFSVGMAPGVVDAGAWYIITDSIGLTDYSDYNSELRVTGAIVGSRSFGITTSMTNSSGAAPDHVRLYQNYPNPFNPSTFIRYDLSARVRVRLTVFTTLGQEVASLVDEIQDAGDHTVKFDGGKLTSGMYFYRLQAGEFVQAKRFLLIR